MRTYTEFRFFPWLLLVLAMAPACRAQQAPAPEEPAAGAGAGAPDSRERGQRIAAVRTRIDKAEAAGPGKSPRAFRVNLPIARLNVEKAELYAASYWSGDRAGGALDGAESALKMLAEGKEAYADVKGLQERAYIAPADGSVQPYWVYVPKKEAPRSGWPVLVYLHGYVPDTSKVNPWLPDDDFFSLSEEKGFLVAVPYGRRNTDFEGIGEQDVLAVIEEVKRYHKVDADRVFMGGPSMGGYGVYVIALHHPDLFAGIVPMCARAIPYVVERRYPGDLPPYKRIAVDSNVPYALAENAKNLPIFLQQGERDYLIDPQHSRVMAERWKTLGCNIRYDEWRGHDHYIYWERTAHAAAYDWARSQRRNPTPKEVVYLTYTPKYHRAYWVSLGGIEEWGKPARIQVRVSGPNQVTVTATNVTEFTLDVPASLVDVGKPLTVTTNGRKETFAAWKPGKPITIALVKTPAGPRKGATVCGPVREAFFAPFLLVPGTRGDAQATALLAGWAKRWAQEWRTFADGDPQVKNDTEVTDADIAGRNLILFGDRNTNAVLARIADRLPVELTPTGYRLGDRKESASDVGLLMTYPNPLAPQRLVCVYSGVFWGDGLDGNHKFDLAPDFILFRNELDCSDPSRTPKAVCAGYFDSRWRLADGLTWK